MLSTQNLLIMLAIAAVLFGGKKLPELGKGVGEAIKNFKKGVSEPAEIEASLKKEETAKKRSIRVTIRGTTFPCIHRIIR